MTIAETHFYLLIFFFDSFNSRIASDMEQLRYAYGVIPYQNTSKKLKSAPIDNKLVEI